LQRCTHLKDLGVTLSDTLVFSGHCKKIAASARRLSGLIMRTFKSRHPKVLIPLLKSIIRPTVEYATTILNPWYQMDIAEIESVQRKFTKCISGLKNLSYERRLQVLNLPTLVKRREYYDLLECYKLAYGLVRSECTQSFVLNRTSTRGHKYKFAAAQQTPRLDIRKHFFTERVMKIWNALPAEIAEITTYAHFKTTLKRHLNV